MTILELKVVLPTSTLILCGFVLALFVYFWMFVQTFSKTSILITI